MANVLRQSSAADSSYTRFWWELACLNGVAGYNKVEHTSEPKVIERCRMVDGVSDRLWLVRFSCNDSRNKIRLTYRVYVPCT